MTDDPPAADRAGERQESGGRDVAGCAPARFPARIGLAIANPRWALAIAGDRRQAGRSGSDLIAMIVMLLAATQLRPIVARIWIGTEVGAGQAVRGVTHVLTRALVLDLAFLVIGALVLWLLSGKRRNIGRAFDLACVAVLPLLFVEIAAGLIVSAFELVVPLAVAWALSLAAWAWTGSLLALATRTARTGGNQIPDPPDEVVRIGKRAGAAVVGVALVACVFQTVWIARNLEDVRPVKNEMPAPQFALPTIIDAKGTLGPLKTLSASRGKITIVDFWATWCKPCIQALPRLDRMARMPDVEVFAINIDDRAAAFTLFDGRYAMTLLADDDRVSDRYGVGAIPHTVVIDREGIVRHVARGESMEIVELIVEQIRK